MGVALRAGLSPKESFGPGLRYAPVLLRRTKPFQSLTRTSVSCHPVHRTPLESDSEGSNRVLQITVVTVLSYNRCFVLLQRSPSDSMTKLEKKKEKREERAPASRQQVRASVGGNAGLAFGVMGAQRKFDKSVKNRQGGRKHTCCLDFLFLLYQDKRKSQRQRLKRQVTKD